MFPEPGAFFAAKSAKLLGSGILQRKEAATKEADKRKSYLIVSFGDYYSGKWCPGLTLFYRYALRFLALMFDVVKDKVL